MAASVPLLGLSLAGLGPGEGGVVTGIFGTALALAAGSTGSDGGVDGVDGVDGGDDGGGE
ncbi:hypothetical protein AAFN86_18190 [Roseomonas sp. CAU 1739]